MASHVKKLAGMLLVMHSLMSLMPSASHLLTLPVPAVIMPRFWTFQHTSLAIFPLQRGPITQHYVLMWSHMGFFIGPLAHLASCTEDNALTPKSHKALYSQCGIPSIIISMASFNHLVSAEQVRKFINFHLGLCTTVMDQEGPILLLI